MPSPGCSTWSRPYFGFDNANVFKKVGSVRSRGAEFSVSGKVTPKLSVVLGGVLLRPRVEADADASGTIGSKPFGLPDPYRQFQRELGRRPSSTACNSISAFPIAANSRPTTDNLVYLPARLNVNVGMHYGFNLAGQAATLRVQMVDLFDDNGLMMGGPGIFGAKMSRQLLGYLTVDL